RRESRGDGGGDHPVRLVAGEIRERRVGVRLVVAEDLEVGAEASRLLYEGSLILGREPDVDAVGSTGRDLVDLRFEPNGRARGPVLRDRLVARQRLCRGCGLPL